MKLQCDPRSNRLDVTTALAQFENLNVGGATRQTVEPVPECERSGDLELKEEPLIIPLDIMASFKMGPMPRNLVAVPRRYIDRLRIEMAA